MNRFKENFKSVDLRAKTALFTPFWALYEYELVSAIFYF